MGHLENAGPPAEVAATPVAAARPEAPEPVTRVVEVPQPEAPQPAAAAEIFSDWTSYSNAVAESERTGKPILIDFNAEWCPPCQRMKREAFEDRAHFDTIRKAVIPVSIVDRQREQGRNPREIDELQERFGIDAFPTLVVLSPRTGRAQKTVGYGGSDYVTWWITDAARQVR